MCKTHHERGYYKMFALTLTYFPSFTAWLVIVLLFYLYSIMYLLVPNILLTFVYLFILFVPMGPFILTHS